MKPTLPRPPARQLAFGHFRNDLLADDDRAGGRLIEPGDEVQERRLARARRAHERQKLGLVHVEIQILQDLDLLAAANKRFIELSDLNDRTSH